MHVGADVCQHTLQGTNRVISLIQKYLPGGKLRKS